MLTIQLRNVHYLDYCSNYLYYFNYIIYTAYITLLTNTVTTWGKEKKEENRPLSLQLEVAL